MKVVKMEIVVLMFMLACAGLTIQTEAADPFVTSASVAVVKTEAGQLQGFVKNGIYTYGASRMPQQNDS